MTILVNKHMFLGDLGVSLNRLYSFFMITLEFVYKHFRVSLGKLYNQLSSSIMHLLHAWGSLATHVSFKNDLPAGCLLLTREESLDQALSRHHKLWPLFAQRACLTKVFLSNSCSLLATFSAVSFGLPNKCEISVSIMQFQVAQKILI